VAPPPALHKVFNLATRPSRRFLARSPMKLPELIQGGMGIAVSNWRLARAVAARGQLGVVSGTAIDSVHARILQDGDPQGRLRSAYARFPAKDAAAAVLDRWFQPEGRAPSKPYRVIPVFNERRNRDLEALTALACFAEVVLARDGRPGALVGINLLDKIRIPQLASLYGAMLAGVDYVLMGAGLPTHVAGILDRFAAGEPATLKFPVEGGGEGEVSFDPSDFLGAPAPVLPRPKFLAIITSELLARRTFKDCADGFVIETPVAGGHNAPPRGKWQENLSDAGEPVYGEKDRTNFAAVAEVGKPFWIGGGFADTGSVAAAKALGAAGVQVGTAFMCCDESGLAPALKRKLISLAKERLARVFTDPKASPTGFPFKVAQVAGTISDPAVYAARERICDMGYLRSAFRREDGGIGFRCASEPVENYVRKGGRAEDAAGRVCLCNSLMAACGYPQVRRKTAPVDILGDTLRDAGLTVEAAIATAGDALCGVARYLKNTAADSYSALDVLRVVVPASVATVVETAAANAADAVAAAVTGAVTGARESVETFLANASEGAAKTCANVSEFGGKVADAANSAAAAVSETYAHVAESVSETCANAAAAVSEASNGMTATVAGALLPKSALLPAKA